MKNIPSAFLLLTIAFLAACATAPPIDMSEPARLLGHETGVRLNAQMVMPNVALHTPIPVTYEIENLRDKPIAVADLVPETTYDLESLTLTIALGSEVPGNEFLPKLTVIPAGEKRSFTAKGTLLFPGAAQRGARPRYIRMKLNFLGDIAPFTQLLDIPEKALHDPKLAGEMFPKWVEANETLVTNAVPIRFTSADAVVEPTRGRRTAPRRP